MAQHLLTDSDFSAVLKDGFAMQGIVGGTYDRYLEGESAVSKPESQLYLPPDVSVNQPSTLPVCCTAHTHAASLGMFLAGCT